MMSRRPPPNPTSKARPPSQQSLTIPSSRSRAALSRSVTSTRSTEDALVNGGAAGPEVLMSPSKRAVGIQKEEAGDNINVVVRCRGRSEREIAEKSPIVITCPMSGSPTPQPQEITIETSPLAPSHVVPGATLSGPPTKTYPFDRVFGPEVDQGTIYEEVVGPLLREVLEGYNCTLFAYGQTGTGKTYTMQGDLTPSPLTGGPSSNAGMIPRALSSLFRTLSATASDYSVKCSYIELYNEELRDLLAPELSAPIGSAQPMSRSKDGESGGGLKLFDDGAKRGVLIQGLEEVAIKDERDAMRLLLKGSQRRQIAATKFNDHSSRSHSVFTITVHSTSPAPPSKLGASSTSENELLKIGKLNLVDLAGSENIGRSGAENKRAREAGMINQSLLTLGRVINALVDRAAHVPYRESKLTRLLQDSLGGRTKTTIIATVSPARNNVEETLSTLDYAIRAKTIRNRPEVNQRLSRGALIREYVAEIERLKADLFAAREKDGIYVSNETWKDLTEADEVKRTVHLEAARRVVELEIQLKSVREEFEQSLALLMRRDGELKDAREKISKGEEDLRTKETELTGVRKDLEEEVVVRKAFEVGEKHVDGVAVELKSVLKDGLDDVQGLFEKISRKSAAFGQNKSVIGQHASKLQQETVRLEAAVEDYSNSHGEAIRGLLEQVEDLGNRQANALADQSRYIDDRVTALVKCIDFIRTEEEHTDAAAVSMATTVRVDGDVVREEVKAWAEGIRDEVKDWVGHVQETQAAGFIEVEKALDDAFGVLQSAVREAGAYAELEKKVLKDTQAAVQQAADAEIHRLQQQNTLLERLLVSERATSQKRRDDLIAQISSLLTGYTEAQDRSLRDTMTHLSAETERCQTKVREEAGLVTGFVEENVGRAGKMAEQFEGWGRRGAEVRAEAGKTIASASSSMHARVSKVSSDVSAAVDAHLENTDKKFSTMNASFHEAYQRVESSKRSRLQATDTLESDVQESYRAIKKQAISSSQELQQSSARIVSETSTLRKSMLTFRNSHSSHVSSIRQNNHAIVEEGAREDDPTGNTPQRRNWRYPEQWDLTASREQVLEDWRRGQEAGPEMDADEAVVEAQTETDFSAHPDILLERAAGIPLPSPVDSPLDDRVLAIPVSKHAKAHAGLRPSTRLPGLTEKTNILPPARPSKRFKQ